MLFKSPSFELLPTITRHSPCSGRIVLVCSSNHSKSSSLREKVTVLCSPAFNVIRWKPRKDFEGPSVSAIFFRYSCTTSVPSRLPVLLTSTLSLPPLYEGLPNSKWYNSSHSQRGRAHLRNNDKCGLSWNNPQVAQLTTALIESDR